MDRTTTTYQIENAYKTSNIKNSHNTSTSYMRNSQIHENYWFQDLSTSIFNLDYALKILPSGFMTYPEKINSIVRLSIYFGLILSFFYRNYLFLYIPIIVMILTYILYIFRIDQLDSKREQYGPNSKLNDISQNNLIDLANKNMSTTYDNYGRRNGYGNRNYNNFKDILNIKQCSKPNNLNPFMNPLLFDSRNRSSACDAVKEENQELIEAEYNKYCIKDVSDIFNHNSGRRQFYTVPSTSYPNNQGGFANWLYKTPPTCKEGNGAQCVANYYVPLNREMITPGVGSISAA